MHLPPPLARALERLRDVLCRARRSHERAVLELALRIEAAARRLDGQAPTGAAAQPEAIEVLAAACTLLERLSDERSTAEAPPGPPPAPTGGADSQPSRAAREVMRVRDWILLAEVAPPAEAPRSLQVVYRKLAELLAKDGITVLEDEGGRVDVDRHHVVETCSTDDPSLHHTIASTVRPGYLFHGELLRPQEVIAYQYHDRPPAAETAERGL